MTPGLILILNAGSSSIKFSVFDQKLQQQLHGLAEGIGSSSRLIVNGTVISEPSLPDHKTALSAILGALSAADISTDALIGIGHRVVHGGSRLTAPMCLTPAARAEIRDCTPLAPLHNPHSLAAIDTMAELAPKVPQFASFDTSFHATNPDVATRYAMAHKFEDQGIRRYGFHGLSYASVVRRLPEVSGNSLPERLLAFHLGNGASICAIRGGQSVATTMGYSPLEGLTMGTRVGGIDANAVLRMVDDYGLERTRRILNHESGLFGLSGGTSDMRKLLQDQSPDSRFAVDHFCYWCLRHAGSLIAALEGVDAVAFTGGIGENAPQIRSRILNGLEWTGLRMDPQANASRQTVLHSDHSALGIWVIPADEERQIAIDTLAQLHGSA